MVDAKKVLISEPDDWVLAWKAAADKAGMNLSEWIGEQCNKSLKPSVTKKLTKRGSVGRPRKDDAFDICQKCNLPCGGRCRK
jgi:hypothetical protein